MGVAAVAAAVAAVAAVGRTVILLARREFR
jgi:hypothetical protein